MKKSNCLLILAFFLLFNCPLPAIEISSPHAPSKGPLLVVVIMEKNEEAGIKQTLQMYCEADPFGQFISYYVYDTGTDPWSPTMEKALELFKNYQVHYVIAQEPFEDFARSRNKALRAAEAHYPHAVFMLMPDAEWYINDVSGLLQFCLQHEHEDQINSYLMRILSTNLDFYTPRLLRAHKNMCFEGVVHEVIKSNENAGMGPRGVHFNYPDEPAGLQKSQQRWFRDRDLLLKEYTNNPLDARNIFYLAQTYDCLNEFDNAYIYYTKRTQLSGFVEEDYMAHYRLGILCERLAQTASGRYYWSEALRHYLDAFLMRPIRAEPLVRIAAYYINQNIYDLAFLYAYMACQIQYPNDVLFVEREIYDKTRYEIFAKAAFKIDLEIPQRVCQEAVKRNEQAVPLEKFLLSQSFLLRSF